MIRVGRYIKYSLYIHTLYVDTYNKYNKITIQYIRIGRSEVW